MTFEIIIDKSIMFTGSTWTIVAIATAILLCIILIILRTLHIQRKNETTKYEFITIIAHKFRTPLTKVKWIIDTILPEERDPLQKKNIRDIETANETLIALMGTLIELTTKNSGQGLTYALERVPLFDIVKDIAEAMKGEFQEKNILCSVQAADPTLAVVVNVTSIRFVVRALLENSLVYSPPGRQVDVLVFKHHRKVCVSVTDSGIGIRSRDLRRVFSQFYRAPNAKKMDTEGFGVSLYMAQSIAHRNNGKIHVFSDGINKGSTFTLMLPRKK